MLSGNGMNPMMDQVAGPARTKHSTKAMNQGELFLQGFASDMQPDDPDKDLKTLEQALTDSQQDATRLKWICNHLSRYHEYLQAATLIQRFISPQHPNAELRLALSNNLKNAGLLAPALYPLRELAKWEDFRFIALEAEAGLRVELKQLQRAWDIYNALIASGYDASAALQKQADLAFQHCAARQLREELVNNIANDPQLVSEAGFYKAWHIELCGDIQKASACYLEHLWDYPHHSDCFIRLSALVGHQKLLQSITGHRFAEYVTDECLQSTLLRIQMSQGPVSWKDYTELTERILHSKPLSHDQALWQAQIAQDLGLQTLSRQKSLCAISFTPGDLPLLRHIICRFWMKNHSPALLLEALIEGCAELPPMGYARELLLTILYLETGNSDSAAKKGEQICEHYPYFSRPWVLQSEILRRQGSAHSALELLARCPETAKTEEVLLEGSIAELDVGNAKNALKQFKQLHLLHTTQKALNAQALCLYLLESVSQCESLLRQSLLRYQANPDAWNQLGIIARERGDYWSALRHFRRALHENPNHAPAHYNLSQLHRYTLHSRHLAE